MPLVVSNFVCYFSIIKVINGKKVPNKVEIYGSYFGKKNWKKIGKMKNFGKNIEIF